MNSTRLGIESLALGHLTGHLGLCATFSDERRDTAVRVRPAMTFVTSNLTRTFGVFDA